MKAIKVLFLGQDKGDKEIGYITQDDKGKLIAKAKGKKLKEQIERLVKLIIGKPLMFRVEKDIDLGGGISKRETIQEEIYPDHPEWLNVVVKRLKYYSINGHRIYGVIENEE